ncbi:hypothetical protein M3J09_010689 [Ascochyta lentis]
MGILKNLVIAVTGTLSADTSQLKKWIEANDGRYSPNVRKGVTHLIAGSDAWKNATNPVQAAVEVGAFVVSYDWLEDSLQRKRKLAETKYTWEHLWRERKRRKQMKRIGTLNDTIKFNKGCEEAKKATGTGTSKSRTATRKPKPSKSFFFADVINVPFVSAADDLKRRREEREAVKARRAEEAAAKRVEDTKSDGVTSRALSAATESLSSPSSATSHTLSTTSFQTVSSAGLHAKKPSLKDLYHYYLDITGFEYKIVLTRCNLRANQITRYRLSVLESHTKPHVYCTFVEYFPPGIGAAGSGEAGCIQALMDFDTSFIDSGVEEIDSDSASTDDTEGTPLHDMSLPEQDTHDHPQATHLRSLLAPPVPSPTNTYKTLLAPMNSPFTNAWRIFRHTFRDLTLLSWEERFDISKTLYKMRAAHFNIEPFVYVRPKPGLPLGLRVQEAGLFQNQTLAVVDRDSHAQGAKQELESSAAMTRNGNNIGNEEDYTYNAHSLPSLAHALGTGIIGTAVQRERAAAEKQKQQAQEAELERSRRQGIAGRYSAEKEKEKKKPNFSRPLFNGVTGRPRTDAWGRSTSGGGVVGGLQRGGIVNRRPFPAERREA